MGKISKQTRGYYVDYCFYELKGYAKNDIASKLGITRWALKEIINRVNDNLSEDEIEELKDEARKKKDEDDKGKKITKYKDFLRIAKGGDLESNIEYISRKRGYTVFYIRSIIEWVNRNLSTDEIERLKAEVQSDTEEGITEMVQGDVESKSEEGITETVQGNGKSNAVERGAKTAQGNGKSNATEEKRAKTAQGNVQSKAEKGRTETAQCDVQSNAGKERTATTKGTAKKRKPPLKEKPLSNTSHQPNVALDGNPLGASVLGRKRSLQNLGESVPSQPQGDTRVTGLDQSSDPNLEANKRRSLTAFYKGVKLPQKGKKNFFAPKTPVIPLKKSVSPIDPTRIEALQKARLEKESQQEAARKEELRRKATEAERREREEAAAIAEQISKLPQIEQSKEVKEANAKRKAYDDFKKIKKLVRIEGKQVEITKFNDTVLQMSRLSIKIDLDDIDFIVQIYKKYVDANKEEKQETINISVIRYIVFQYMKLYNVSGSIGFLNQLRGIMKGLPIEERFDEFIRFLQSKGYGIDTSPANMESVGCDSFMAQIEWPSDLDL